MFENGTELKLIYVARCIPNCFLGKAGKNCNLAAKDNNRNMFFQYRIRQKFANTGRRKHLLSDFLPDMIKFGKNVRAGST